MRRRWAAPLLGDILRGNSRMLEPLLDLLALPLASGVALLLLTLLLPVFWVRLYAILGLFSFALYVLVSASFAPQPLAALRALLSVPGYMLWKLINLPRTRLAARHNAAWVRTERNPSDDINRTPPPRSP